MNLFNSMARRLLTFVCISIVLLLGIFVILNSLGLRYKFQTYYVLTFVYFFIIWIKDKRRFSFVLKGKIEIAYFAFVVAVLLSGIINLNKLTIVSAIIGLVVLFLCQAIPYETLLDSYFLYGIAYIVVVFITFQKYSIDEINSEGCIFASLGIVILNIICLKKWDYYWLFILVSVIIIFLIMLTRARTPLITFLVVDVITFFYLFKKRSSIKRMIILLTSMAVLFYSLEKIIVILNQYFFHKWGNSDLTSARADYWKLVFKKWSLFGYGMGSGSTIPSFDFNAHNSWVQVLGCFGIVAFLLFIILTVILMLKVRYATHKIIFINFFSGWFVMSMFEDLSIFSSRYVPIVIGFILHMFLLDKEIKKGRLMLSQDD